MGHVERTITASEFQAGFRDLLDQLASHRVDRLVITDGGKAVAVLTAPQSEWTELYGCLKGRTVVPEGVDLTAPVLDEPLNADEGRLHE